jgi:hypothetical protein
MSTLTSRNGHSGILIVLGLTLLIGAGPAEAAQSRCPNGPDNAVEVTVNRTTCAEARRVVRAWSRACIGPILGSGSLACSLRTSTRAYRCINSRVSTSTGRVRARCDGPGRRTVVRFKFYVADQGPE